MICYFHVFFVSANIPIVFMLVYYSYQGIELCVYVDTLSAHSVYP